MPQTTSLLSAYQWELPGQLVSTIDHPVLLQFGKQQVSVLGLCNAIGGSYEIKGEKIRIRPMAATLKMCPEQALMQAEQIIGQQLPTVEGWAISNSTSSDEPILTLTFSDGKRWQLTGRPTDETR